MITSGNFPDVSAETVRSDFTFLFDANKQQVTRIRNVDTESGNYGAWDEETTEDRTVIWLNIQGISSDYAERAKFGLSVAGSVFHAYAKYNEDIQVTDIFEFNNTKYKVQNHNKSYKDGVVVFQEFDLVQTATVNNGS